MEPQDATGRVSPPFRDVVTEDEIREVLSPLGESGGSDLAPVLLLAARPEDERWLAAFFEGRGVSVATANSSHLAFDLFRAHPYSAFVASRDALPSDPAAYLDRLRAVDGSIRFVVLQEAEEDPLPAPVRTVARPLSETSLDPVFGFPPATRPASGPAVVKSAAPRPRPVPDASDSGATTAPPTPARGSGPRPEPLRAVQALLEARLNGRDFGEGLRRWATTDPAIHAWVEAREGAESEFQVGGGDRDQRRRTLAAFLEHLDGWDEGSGEAAARGPFTLFPLSPQGRRVAALLHADSGAAEEALAGLRPFLPLIDMVTPPETSGDADAARGRFVALLESRMRAAQRGAGRLGILVLEGASGDRPREMGQALRSLLRGGDWVEPVGRRVYAILDCPDGEVFHSLGERLQELPAADRMRVVALGWQPGDGEAGDLAARAERLLAEGSRGDLLPGSPGADQPG